MSERKIGNGAPSSGPQNLQTKAYDKNFGATPPMSPSMARREAGSTDQLVNRKTRFTPEPYQHITDPQGTKGQG